jgi:hypothetical protein
MRTNLDLRAALRYMTIRNLPRQAKNVDWATNGCRNHVARPKPMQFEQGSLVTRKYCARAGTLSKQVAVVIG